MQLTPIMEPEALNRFLEADFPQLHTDGKVFEVTEVGPGTVIMRLMPNERHLRPGGTISGPTLFALAVTTNLNINFLRKPAPGPLSCTCRILKLGKRLAVVEASIFDADSEDLVAHATATYSIPPR